MIRSRKLWFLCTDTYVFVAKVLGVIEGRLGGRDDVTNDHLVAQLGYVDVAGEVVAAQAARVQPLGRRAQPVRLQGHRRRGAVHRHCEQRYQ